MKPSEELYGKYYDKEFVQLHAVLFMRQKRWAEQVLLDLLDVPSEERDWDKIRQALDTIKWNEDKYEECHRRE